MKSFLHRILHPGGKIMALLAILTTALLICVFRSGDSESILACAIYTFSFYTLVVFCLRLPDFIGWIKGFLVIRPEDIHTGHPNLDRFLIDCLYYESRTRRLMWFSLLWNLLYAAFKIITGYLYQSPWFAVLGFFYAVLALARFLLFRSFRKTDLRAGETAYRRTAWMLLCLTIALTLLVSETIKRPKTFNYPGLFIYVFALYAFVKSIAAIYGLLHRRREENLTLAASRCISFACALLSILALQTALIYQFGDADFGARMNGIFGAVATALMLVLAITMFYRIRKIRKEA